MYLQSAPKPIVASEETECSMKGSRDMSEPSSGLLWGKHKRERYRSVGAPPSMPVLSQGTVSARIGAMRPAFIAHKDDVQANEVLNVFKRLVVFDDITIHLWREQSQLCDWFLRNGRTPNSCVAVLTGLSMTKPGTFILAGARRGKSLTRIHWQRGWVGSLGIMETWHQIIYISPKFTAAHGAQGMAEQIASWLRQPCPQS